MAQKPRYVCIRCNALVEQPTGRRSLRLPKCPQGHRVARLATSSRVATVKGFMTTLLIFGYVWGASAFTHHRSDPASLVAFLFGASLCGNLAHANVLRQLTGPDEELGMQYRAQALGGLAAFTVAFVGLALYTAIKI